MKNIELGKRMTVLASFVRSGSYVADIGTDHAKLPIYLLQNNICDKCMATDINIQPLNRAKENLVKYNLLDKAELVLTNGLDNLDEYDFDDIIIAGMGGELIADILERGVSSHKNARFILQPMTKEAALRKFLYDNGFDIIDETVVFEGKVYQIIVAVFDGVERSYTETDLLVGKCNKTHGNEYFDLLVKKHINMLKKRISGKEKTENADGINQDKALLDELLDLIK